MQAGQESVACGQHGEKCVFVCLFKTCKEAFRVGCVRCRKEHAQHPNRLVALADFHPMLGRPIRYLENLTAFKLINLKRKVEYIRDFRTDILEKEAQLIDSNRAIKGTMAAILAEHETITEVVSHVDAPTLAHDYALYADSLQRCKAFLAYNPVNRELVFNNDVIKNSRILLEKQLKTSQELIDSIRELLVKIIEVLLAHCAHDEDDDDIEFAQTGDDPTTFNIFIKHRTDVTENPNIKSKLEHHAFLQIFDDQNDAFAKDAALLEQEIATKAALLRKIRSQGPHPHHSHPDKDSISEKSEREESSRKEIDLDALEELRAENKELRQQLANLQQQEDEKGQTPTCESVGSRHSEAELEQLRAQIERYEIEIAKEKERSVAAIRQLEARLEEANAVSAKQAADLAVLSKKCSGLQAEANRKRQEQESDRLSSRSSQEEASRRMSEMSGRLARKEEEAEKREREVQKERKRYGDLEKLVEKMKENSASIERESHKWREEYQGREKYMRAELEKAQKELDTLKYKVRNDEERNKNIESKVKDLTRDLEAKNELIREKDRTLREKEQLWQAKTTTHTSRLKELENELKNSRISDSLARNHEEEVRKHKETKDLLEMSIKKGQDLKDRIFELEAELAETRAPKPVLTSVLEQTDSKPNTTIFMPEQLHIETVNSEELLQDNSLSREEPVKKEEARKEELVEKKALGKGVCGEERRVAYLEIKSIFKAVAEDMGILEERLKENSVIEKVYLKELERKRNENKALKKELENIKLYGGTSKPADGPQSLAHTPRLEKEKKDAKSPSPHGNKVEPLSGMRKKV